jgi:quinol monooxygenase YgiN
MATRIIISGTIDMPPENTLRAIETARPLIEGALTEEGCLDYDWCPNPLVPGRIRILERWESEEALAAHFKSDWYLKMREHIGNFGLTNAETLKYKVGAQEPVYDETMTPRADFFTESDEG